MQDYVDELLEGSVIEAGLDLDDDVVYDAEDGYW